MGKKRQANKKVIQKPQATSPAVVAAGVDSGRSSLIDLLARWGFILSAGLFFGRLLIPVESAAAGDTALFVLPWCVLLAASGWLSYRGDLSAKNFRIDLGDIGLLTILTGMLIAGGSVWANGGQLRAALNMSWEWIGIAFSVLLMRRLWTSSTGPILVGIVIGIGTALSAQGAYQYLVQLPAQRAAVMPLVEEYLKARERSSGNELSGVLADREAEKVSQLERELYENGIPTEPRALRMFVERLNSSEPFGQFALANTLAGFLAVCLLLQLGVGLRMLRAIERVSLVEWLTFLLSLALTSYCLTLTKSRTAWVGAAVGVLLLAGCLPAGQRFRKRLLWGMAGTALLIGGGVAVAIMTGALDIEVITEANKSLQYRFEYWSASLSMLRDHWFFGVGPGNFRQNYLGYKLPYSSEEILDPHNLWFDAWANGGLLALLGLGVVVFVMLRRLMRTFLESGDSASVVGGHALGRMRVPTGAAVVTAGVCALMLPSPEIASLFETILVLCAIAAVTAVLFASLVDRYGISQYAVVVAAFSLFVHLNGAGGFSMPGIIALLFLLGLGVERRNSSEDVPQSKSLRYLPLGTAALALVMAGAGLLLVIPAEVASWSAAQRLATATSSRSVQLALHDWAKQDPITPSPWMQFGQTYKSLAVGESGSINKEYATAAVEAFEKAIELDEHNYHPYRELADIYAEMAKAGNDSLWKEAIKYQQEAITRYPGSADLRAEFASYLAESGDDAAAAEQAEQALQINVLNEKAGHVDRLLGEEDVALLKKLLEGRESPNNRPPSS